MSDHDIDIEVKTNATELIDKIREWHKDLLEMLEEDKSHES